MDMLKATHKSRLYFSISLFKCQILMKGYGKMGLTRRKDGRWCKTKTINGERIFFYSTEPTERKAIKDIENQMIEYNGKIQRGKLFKDVATEWEREHYEKIAHQTMHRYVSLTAKIKDSFGSKYIKQITVDDINKFLSELVYLKYSTKTIKDEVSVLKMIFKYADSKCYISSNVTQFISPPKGEPKKERTALADDEIKIIDNNIDKEFGLLAYFILYSGLRKGEALALTYGDIDMENNIIHVTKSVEHINNTPHIKTTKTKAGIRSVPLLDKLKSVLPKGESDEIIFNQNGEYMTASYFHKHWKKYKEQTGLDVTAHQLRHTFTTLLFEWDIDEKDSQEILGHSDISTTRNIYTHIRKNRMTDTLNKINQKLSESCQ